jgi:tetratricopeptide (TPR) repeat protein
MFRRCTSRRLARAVPQQALLLLGAFLLSGCGSTSAVKPTASETKASVPAQPPVSSAQTFPLEGERSRSSASANTQAPGVQRDGSAPEMSLPPEALQEFDRAVALVNAGNSGAAEQAFSSLAEKYPMYSGPLVNLGILQSKAGRFEEAEKSLKAALERKPDHAAAYNQLGIVYRHQGRFKEAEAAYVRAVEIDPNYANAYLNLGVLCDLYLQQPQRALESFERYLALSSAPDERVANWVRELKVRLESAQRASGAGS